MTAKPHSLQNACRPVDEHCAIHLIFYRFVRGRSFQMMTFVLAALAAQAVSSAVEAVNPANTDSPEHATSLRLPALTEVRLVVLEDLISKTAVTGQEFDIALAESIRLGNGLMIPAGTRGRGWVVHADKPKMGGKPGELLLAARHLEIRGTRIPLRSMKLGLTGKNKETLAIALSAAGGLAGATAAMFITGTNAKVANGMIATAKTAADVDLPIGVLAPAIDAPLAQPFPPPPLGTNSKNEEGKSR